MISPSPSPAMTPLKSVNLREIRLALREPFIISSGEQHLRRILLLEIADEDGATAWSECVAQEFPNYSSETVDTAWHALREWIIPPFLGMDLNPREVANRIKHIRGHRMAKAAFEMAAWALQAEKSQLPLAVMLGGRKQRVPVGISIGLQNTPEKLAAEAHAALEEGYRKVKVKIKPGADVEFLAAVRDAIGKDAPLAADANSAYRLADAELLSALDRFDLIMLEQPLQHDDLLRHAELQKSLKTPICLDESITGLDRTEDMIHLKAGRIVNIKPGRVGGFAASIAIHDVCAAHGIPVWCGGMLESGIGRAHNVALATLDNFSLPGDLSPSRRYWEHDIVTPEWTMSPDGYVEVPVERAGLGVQVDRDRIDDLTVREKMLST